MKDSEAEVNKMSVFRGKILSPNSSYRNGITL